MKNGLKPFHSTVKDPSSAARAVKKKGRPIIGYLCSYAPEELIFAAGGHPMRLIPSGTSINLSQNHLQPYCCALAREILEQGLSQELTYLDGTVFVHTCDTMQRLSDIWRLNISTAFFSDIVMPVKLHTKSAGEYMQAVLHRFISDMGEYTGKAVTRADLEDAIALFNRIRSTLAHIYKIAAQNPGLISGQDLLTVTKGTMIMDREVADTCLADLARAMESAEKKSKPVTPIILSGSFCDTPEIYTVIEAAGGAVAGDDLCSGMRWFNGDVSTNLPAIQAVAKRYTDRAICPAKHRGTTDRAYALLQLVKETKSQGVIFTVLKFCDPHAFDFPYLKSSLAKEGIPSLLLELDGQRINSGQMATRIETFIQMIQGQEEHWK
ncbi:2-hydroxyacyl-CoA dehydratase family protein [uncultured Desulfobacter sp.]|uniref:2-hydroxyacyl-CoA dehydratase subunit D n=1 Tax=uncultured Desulfobacter sp. TaxID=240139 RepID=UPI002AAB59BF|nr:2-hydroxyacyl-CoA dehydratase family protein [uncultured Desulfobacter sp.]